MEHLGFAQEQMCQSVPALFLELLLEGFWLKYGHWKAIRKCPPPNGSFPTSYFVFSFPRQALQLPTSMDFPNMSWYDGIEDNRTSNDSSLDPEPHQYNYYAMLLTLLIFVIVFGNVLVCMAVSREKALQTTTNYLIVSLAVADLLVATLVMPWGVYLEVGRCVLVMLE